MTAFYLSFADETGWLGACVVEGQTFAEAVQRAWQLGINPGGDVRSIGPLPDDVVHQLPYPMDRLLTREEIGDLVPWPESESTEK